MSEPTFSVSPPPSASTPPPELSLLSSLVLLELELLLPPPQPATTSAAIASRSAAKSAAGRILVIRFVPPFGLEGLEHTAAWPPCSNLRVNFAAVASSPLAVPRRNYTVRKYAASVGASAFTQGQSERSNLGQPSKV